MKFKRWHAVTLLTAATLVFVGHYYWFTFTHFGSFGAPALASAVPPADCTVENPVPLDIKAEAAHIEALATEVTANWSRVQTDPRVHAKAVELADVLHRLHNTNYVSCPGTTWPPRYGYTAMAFVAAQIRRDQGLGFFSSFPDMHVFGNIYTGEPELLEFWHKSGDVVIEVTWNRSFDQSDQLEGWINDKSSKVRGSFCAEHSGEPLPCSP